jgi:hypothetical protein
MVMIGALNPRYVEELDTLALHVFIEQPIWEVGYLRSGGLRVSSIGLGVNQKTQKV